MHLSSSSPSLHFKTLAHTYPASSFDFPKMLNHRHSHSSKHSHGFPETRCVVEWIQRIATANAVVIFSRSSCCLCHTVKQLFSGMGVNSTVYEIDKYWRGEDLEKALMWLGGGSAVPLVFVGGILVGGIDRVIGSHIRGTLVPLLREAGAIWL